MKVRVLKGKSFVSNTGTKTPGVVFDASEADAKHLVDGGWCEYVEMPKPVEEVKKVEAEEITIAAAEKVEAVEIVVEKPKKRGRKKKGDR